MSSPAIQPVRSGGTRLVLEAAAQALREQVPACLVIVMDTEGSTYAKAGALACVTGTQQVGWLSGGCLEPEIQKRACIVAAGAGCDAMEIDSRDDEDLFSPSAVGCRGRLRLLLLPLQAMPGAARLIDAWTGGAGCLHIDRRDEALHWSLGDIALSWPMPRVTDTMAQTSTDGAVAIAAPPAVLLLGLGPEAPLLISQLRLIGWRVVAAERRARWQSAQALADEALDGAPATIVQGRRAGQCVAALVMHHHFELDREALLALSASDVPFIGLLGPRRRRDDLFKLLPVEARDALSPRLHAPVGLDLGGFGVEAIALSIAAQLQAWWHGR